MGDVTEISVRGTHSVSQSQRQQFDAVHSLLLPLNSDIILLPNAAVAEVIPFNQPEAIEDAPDWLLGYINWRERRVPLVMFESASEGNVGSLHRGCRIAVLNTLNGNNELPYIAIVMQSLPSLQIVRANAIQYGDRPPMQRQSVKAYVNLNGVAAIVPDIDDLEARLMRIQH
ncbi:MAG: chemotaxis protein CheW [Gammaproteobacteria bacterium]|jgi:chemosensory pili system protein ChpC